MKQFVLCLESNVETSSRSNKIDHIAASAVQLPVCGTTKPCPELLPPSPQWPLIGPFILGPADEQEF